MNKTLVFIALALVIGVVIYYFYFSNTIPKNTLIKEDCYRENAELYNQQGCINHRILNEDFDRNIDNWITYKNEEFLYSFKYPPGFEIVKREGVGLKHGVEVVKKGAWVFILDINDSSCGEYCENNPLNLQSFPDDYIGRDWCSNSDGDYYNISGNGEFGNWRLANAIANTFSCNN